jgi:hypothetical protein
MQRRGVLACCAACLLLVSLAGCQPVADIIGGQTSGGSTDLLQLMNKAEQIVGADYPLSVLIEVAGAPSAGVAFDARDINLWQFRFVDDIYATFPATVVLDYAGETFAAPERIPWPLWDTVFEELPREMSLAQAVGLLRDAGYDEPFSAVALRRPLVDPLPDEPYFVFTLPGKFVFVGVLTGHVSEGPLP